MGASSPSTGNHRGFEGKTHIPLIKGIDSTAVRFQAKDVDLPASGGNLGQQLPAASELCRVGHDLSGVGVRLHQGAVGGRGVLGIRIGQVIVDVIPDDDRGRDVVKHDVSLVLRADPGLFEFLGRPWSFGIGYALQLLVAQKLVPVQGRGRRGRRLPGSSGGACQSAADQKENRRQGGYRLSQGLCPTFH